MGTLRLSSQLWFHTQTIHVLQDRRTASMFYFKLGEFFSYCHVVALLHQAIVTLIASEKVTSEIAQTQPPGLLPSCVGSWLWLLRRVAPVLAPDSGSCSGRLTSESLVERPSPA